MISNRVSKALIIVDAKGFGSIHIDGVEQQRVVGFSVKGQPGNATVLSIDYWVNQIEINGDVSIAPTTTDGVKDGD